MWDITTNMGTSSFKLRGRTPYKSAEKDGPPRKKSKTFGADKDDVYFSDDSISSLRVNAATSSMKLTEPNVNALSTAPQSIQSADTFNSLTVNLPGATTECHQENAQHDPDPFCKYATPDLSHRSNFPDKALPEFASESLSSSEMSRSEDGAEIQAIDGTYDRDTSFNPLKAPNGKLQKKKTPELNLPEGVIVVTRTVDVTSEEKMDNSEPLGELTEIWGGERRKNRQNSDGGGYSKRNGRIIGDARGGVGLPGW